MEQGKVIIRKYGNRRLYDTSTSRYVNLEELAEMIRNGNDVVVVDAKTGEDFTRTTLTQIIAEETKDHPAGLPVELLRQLILASDKVRQEFMTWYLKSAFESYHKIQSAFQNGLSQMGSAAFSPLETFRKFVQGNESSAEENEVQTLRARIAQLEAQLQQQKKARKPRAKSAAAPKKVSRQRRKRP